ncbi:LysR family transcriptional regulator [Roseovarius pelagicus]|uniref:LysR family transcriptional regulator n=1 Tax=Roseovarius pelagicus TaxID=2980108 RepID=A0ABY6D5T9_9RHOB|nr:LysR family transcriptional regulator [Roseovarius pelagicus]UXX81509.1 LysR family transcriptional regulator [Roseovarius pelagicus]
MNVAFAQTFLEVVKVGNLNRAAARLNVTESTVTTRINALENHLGQKLLIRSRSGAELTPAGFKFLRYAEVMTQAWGLARQELSLSQDFKSICNVGCHLDLWDASGCIWVDYLRQHHPEVALSFWLGNVDDIERWLSSGLIDVALMFDSAVSGGYRVRKLFDDRLIQVSTRARSYVDWDPDYIYVDLGGDFRRLHAEAFSVARTPVITISSSNCALNYLLRWGGSAYLPTRMVTNYISDGTLSQVEGTPEFCRTAYAVSRSDIAKDRPWFDPSFDYVSAQIEKIFQQER